MGVTKSKVINIYKSYIIPLILEQTTSGTVICLETAKQMSS